ncbi:hypothetical protein SDC9_189263 [bioreactor metagenome]|uniref:Uncharacterized protein n=1 Tax=bioreactor metagenome TaxID=1076179 RepID=A0A645HRN0_9ZZZZ
MAHNPKDIELVIVLYDIIFDIATIDVIVTNDLVNCFNVFMNTSTIVDILIF